MKLERNAISRTYVAAARTPTATGDAMLKGLMQDRFSIQH